MTHRNLAALQHVAVALGGTGHLYDTANWIFPAVTLFIGATLLDHSSIPSDSFLVRAVTHHERASSKSARQVRWTSRV
eukprot:CAMPEP_0179419000 /NCGR_PEP_ID=MMETSP0799-20121207/8350_1 /TAXON_ID=46947 /ORGANISM="Geminigera cryophila, Strain CCMP2564" /LENGTH=77 /DNA_ID=CAMNT_0021192413 /DNA_START=180 /DNA_END=413 /DNA_ORIENTATION=-